MNRFMVYGHYTDPYTGKIHRIDRVVSIGSKLAAAKWAKQSFHKAFVGFVDDVTEAEAKGVDEVLAAKTIVKMLKR